MMPLLLLLMLLLLLLLLLLMSILKLLLLLLSFLRVTLLCLKVSFKESLFKISHGYKLICRVFMGTATADLRAC